MNTAFVCGNRRHRALLLIGIAWFILSLPLALTALLWMPVMLVDRQWMGSVIAGLWIVAPAVQLAVLRRGDDLHRSGRDGWGAIVLASQSLTLTAVALWIVQQ